MSREPLTVEDLIKQLEKLPPETKVLCNSGDGCTQDDPRLYWDLTEGTVFIG